MPLFSTNRGYIGGSNAAITILSVDFCEDEEKLRKIVTRLLGRLPCM